MRRNNRGIKQRSELECCRNSVHIEWQHWIIKMHYTNILTVEKYFNLAWGLFELQRLWLIITNWTLSGDVVRGRPIPGCGSPKPLNSPELIMSEGPVSKMIQTRKEPATVFRIHEEARSRTFVILLRNGEDLWGPVTWSGLGGPDTHLPPEHG